MTCENQLQSNIQSDIFPRPPEFAQTTLTKSQLFEQSYKKVRLKNDKSKNSSVNYTCHVNNVKLKYDKNIQELDKMIYSKISQIKMGIK